MQLKTTKGTVNVLAEGEERDRALLVFIMRFFDF